MLQVIFKLVKVKHIQVVNIYLSVTINKPMLNLQFRIIDVMIIYKCYLIYKYYRLGYLIVGFIRFIAYLLILIVCVEPQTQKST